MPSSRHEASSDERADAKDQPNVLVLTPVKTAARHVEAYLDRIDSLTYPKSRLSIGLLESDSADATWSLLEKGRSRLEARCRRVTLVKRDFNFRISPTIPRWAPAIQQMRRVILARARNHLLFRALDDEDYVLWLDVDVIGFPADMLETLLALHLDIVHPHCVIERGGRTFDRNGWSHHGERHLEDYRDQAGPVRLDAVGGTVLLIRADLHRDGLIFPPFRYGVGNASIRTEHPVWGRGEIETEGLGIMAADMGHQSWGLPAYEVLHAPE